MMNKICLLTRKHFYYLLLNKISKFQSHVNNMIHFFNEKKKIINVYIYLIVYIIIKWLRW